MNKLTPEERQKEITYAYDLVYFSTDNGSGYIVRRIKDQQKLNWYTLPRSDGLESIQVVGCSHYLSNLQQSCFYVGAKVLLVPEKDNKYDPNAIAVWDINKRFKIGYIPKEEAKRINKKIANGEIETSIIMWESTHEDQTVSFRLLLIGPNASIRLPSRQSKKGLCGCGCLIMAIIILISIIIISIILK